MQPTKPNAPRRFFLGEEIASNYRGDKRKRYEARDDSGWTGVLVAWSANVRPFSSLWARGMLKGEEFVVSQVAQEVFPNDASAHSYLSWLVGKDVVPDRRDVTFDLPFALEDGDLQFSTISGSEALKAAFESKRRAHEAVMWLCENFGVSWPKLAHVCQEKGPAFVAAVANNPYALVQYGVLSYERVRALVRTKKLSVPDDEQYRAVIYDSLRKAERSGHTIYPFDLLLSRTAHRWRFDETVLRNEALSPYSAFRTKTIGDDVYFCLGRAFELEQQVYAQIEKRKSVAKQLDIDKANRYLGEHYATMTDEQRNAALLPMVYPVGLVTGGPGTGKTFTIRALVDAYLQSGEERSGWPAEVMLLAPTAKAAMLLEPICELGRKYVDRIHKPTTIHKVIYDTRHNDRQDAIFRRVGLVIIDEMSMVDVELMHDFLSLLPNESRMVMVGDPDQLPSIGAGSLLRDLIETNAVPAQRLTKTMRQKAGSGILDLAHAVRDGVVPDWRELTTKDDVAFQEIKNGEQGRRAVMRMVEELLAQGVNRDDIVVLTPRHSGQLGTTALNYMLSDALKAADYYYPQKVYGRWWRLGDRVMQTVNNRMKGVFNGEVGEIIEVNRDKSVVVAFDGGREIVCKGDEVSELDLAYAMTVHKSQGSQYPHVIMTLLASEHGQLLSKALLYTGITRATQCVHVISDKESIMLAVQGVNERPRWTIGRAVHLEMLKAKRAASPAPDEPDVKNECRRGLAWR